VLVGDRRPGRLDGDDRVPAELPGDPVPGHQSVEPGPARPRRVLVGGEPLRGEDLVLHVEVVGRRVVDRRYQVDHGVHQLRRRVSHDTHQLVFRGGLRRFAVQPRQDRGAQLGEELAAVDRLRLPLQTGPCGEGGGPLGVPPVDEEAGAAGSLGLPHEVLEQLAAVAAPAVLGMHHHPEPGQVGVVPFREEHQRGPDRRLPHRREVRRRGLAVPAVTQHGVELLRQVRMLPGGIGRRHDVDQLAHRLRALRVVREEPVDLQDGHVPRLP
jgi:hypothetical protein